MRFIVVVFLTIGVVMAALPVTPVNEKTVCSVQADCPQPTFAKCQDGYCDHKDLLPPASPEILGILILPILLGLANNGGVGGGGLIIPICIALFGFSTIQAIALSNSTIFVGGAVRFFGFSLR
jgi:hypothetical protein